MDYRFGSLATRVGSSFLGVGADSELVASSDESWWYSSPDLVAPFELDPEIVDALDPEG